MRSIDLAFAGISIGAIAALSGIGLLVTYRTNGVLNIAQGGIAALVAYIFRAMVVDWKLPVQTAAVLSLVVISPLIGIVLERFVFRPLARRRASAAESLVVSLGVLVLTVGMTAGIWGLGSRNDAPSLFPERTVPLPGGSRIGVDALAELALVVAVCVTLGLVTTRTRFGRQVRAVVDDRQLAELSAIPADQVAAAGWAVGTTLAGFTGILLAPRLQLTPYGLTLLVLETFAVVVAARLASLPGAVLTALAIGILQSELSQFQVTGEFSALYLAVQSNLFVAALLVLLLLVPRLRELGGDAGSTGRFSSRGAPQAGRASLTDQRRDILGKFGGAVLLSAPLTFAPTDLRDAFAVPALALIFLSLVIVTGYSGQVSLGVAGYAGLGALLSAKLAAGDLFGLPPLPSLVALLLGALLVAPIGLLTGYPAIRRRGLALALTTFAVGAVVSRFVFQQQTFVSGLHVTPLSIAGHTLSDRWFYVVELACLGLGLLVVRNLHEGRLGRALLAVRDHTEGAAAVGVDVRNLKLLSFTVSAAVAGLGGALLMLGYASFDADTFSPLNSLLWFTAVVVFGADSAAGAVVAAGFIVTIDTLAPAGSATLAVGILALTLGWLPGGLASAVRHLVAELGNRIVEDLTEPGRVGSASTGAGADTVRTAAAASTQARSTTSTTSAASRTLVVSTPLTSVTSVAYRRPAGGAGAPTLTPFGEALLTRVRQVAHTPGKAP
ncbi:ABC transporter permease [Protofrankia symbiont of Coriaria ruscifolia]|uniref:ABC transporter permease n=1 Tax=Protofrankia symbiont of Coriaria ruscifolia TaxID=1306542 RepID=UPI0010414BEE|nr:ABC transporter permease [Protofrankia symbiont of Coriaria ruscifolia]